MFYSGMANRARNRAFDELQEATIDVLRGTEVAGQLGAHALGLSRLLEEAVPIGLKDSRLVIPKHRNNKPPLVLMLLDDEHEKSIDISPAQDPTIRTVERQIVSLEAHNPNLKKVLRGALYSSYASSTPSTRLIGDFIRTSPLLEGPIIMSRGPGDHATLAHEIDHLSYIREGRAVASRSVLTEVTEMELRAHETSYAIHRSDGKIQEGVDIGDIKEAHARGAAAQRVGELLFDRLRTAYGGVGEQFSSHYVHAVREISGNQTLEPTPFEETLLVVGGQTPNVDEQRNAHRY